MKWLQPDSPVMQKINDIIDFVLVNIVFLLCCIPIFTIGAAKCALYASLTSYIRYQEIGVKIFWKKFRENFPVITPLFLLLLAAGALLGVDIWLVVGLETENAVLLRGLVAVLIVLYLFVSIQILLLQSRFVCTRWQLLVNAVLTALSCPLRTALIALMEILPLVLALLAAGTFMWMVPIFFLLYYTLTAYFSLKLMESKFNSYSQKLEPESES